jgi:serine/threonine protein kinase
MTESFFELLPGRSLGPHYEIIEFLGSGWEGEVYKVQERLTGIIRAAKLFYEHRGGRKEPLLKYARKLYKLRSCPIIIQYHHRGVARLRKKKQVEFLVSDFVDGEMLSSFLARQKKKRLSSFEALHLFYALTLGVEQIHFLGEYHGDIHSDNIMVRRRGLGFDVHLLDFFDLGRPTKEKIQIDVYDMITVLYEMIGETDGYRRSDSNIRQIIKGRKHSLISQCYKNAGQLRLTLDNLDWETGL